MPYYPKKPRLTHEDVIREIYNRTGFPVNGIYQVLGCYNDIVKESLLEEVEIPFGDIGFFSWKQINPRQDATVYNPKYRIYEEHRDIPGFRKTVMRINPKWHNTLKEATLDEPWAEGNEGK